MFSNLCIFCVLVVFVSGQKSFGSSEKDLDSTFKTSTYKYPTATWSAPNYNRKNKYLDDSKLYLFKPSPFLKPPFTDGDVGATITSIEDGVNVSGRRKGHVKWKNSTKVKLIKPTEKPKDKLDKFLEESLRRYIKSANLTDEFGMISVETFSEILAKITEMRRTVPYDENKELRMKFREEVLSPKKVEVTTTSGLLEKQYQRRLQKTWEVLNENSSKETRMNDVPTTESLKAEISQDLDRQETAAAFFQNGLQARDRIDITTAPSYVEDDWVTSNPEEEITVTPVYEETTTMRPTSTTTKPLKTTKVNRGKKKYMDTVPKENREWDDGFYQEKKYSKDEMKKKVDKGEVQLSVAETVYYRPKQSPLQTFTYRKEPEYGAIPGEPERDYPMFSSPPKTDFKCPDVKEDGPKMMADPKTRCQVFYICTGEGPPAPMLCPNGTMFNQNVLVCDWWFNVDC